MGKNRGICNQEFNRETTWRPIESRYLPVCVIPNLFRHHRQERV